jgi:hypothetical protein
MSRYARLAFTDAVRTLQRTHGSDRAYARYLEERSDEDEAMGERERAFITSRDGFYLATVGETGWPYVQYRGGPPGFVHVLDERTFAFADVRGNRQYITTGNLATDDRIAVLFMDYPRRSRLKVFGRATTQEVADDCAAAEALCSVRTDGRVERLVVVTVEGLNWNCHQHITPRFSEEELAPVLEQFQARLSELERENDELRARLAAGLDLQGGAPLAPTVRAPGRHSSRATSAAAASAWSSRKACPPGS